MVSSFATHFHLSQDQDISSFFWNKHDVLSQITTQGNRFLHFVRTGIWIDRNSVATWAQLHPEKKISQHLNGKHSHRHITRAEEQKYILPKKNTWETIVDIFRFTIEFIKHPTTIGSIFPSSRSLAKEIISEIPKEDDKNEHIILEVGPGTGAFTDRIIERMNKKAVLHLVEYDELFCEQLTARYQTLIETGRVKIFNCSITEFEANEKYDFIISGLPLNAFEVSFVQQILDKFNHLSKKGSKLSYFEYPFTRDLACALAPQKDRERLLSIRKIKEEFFNTHKDHETTVYMNIPPARVLHHVM